MTDRVNFLSVALDQDVRIDDVQALINAISMMRGVLKVEANIADMASWTAETRARDELSRKLWAALYPDSKLYPPSSIT